MGLLSFFFSSGFFDSSGNGIVVVFSNSGGISGVGSGGGGSRSIAAGIIGIIFVALVSCGCGRGSVIFQRGWRSVKTQCYC